MPSLNVRRLLIGATAAVALLATACNGGGGSNPGDNPGGTSATGNGSSGGTATPALPAVTLERIAEGFTRPVYVTTPPDDASRLFVVEKTGKIRIVRDGQIAAEPFLDVTSLITAQGNEQGLFSIAFHPDYASNGRFFIMYTANSAGSGDNTVAEYRVSSNPDRADPASAKVLLAIPDRAQNHNGGQVTFGPDGYLYVGTGDGGGAGDTAGNAQNKDVLLGKVLRLDVDNVPAGQPYGIPASNPFVNESGTKPEIWAYGLRNPWRFSFDRETKDLYIADVGQNQWEELNLQPAASKGGENYGWNTMEARACFPSGDSCDKTGLVQPIAMYTHNQGCSITGGYVYRGDDQPALKGWYLFTDYCSGNLWIRRAGETDNFNSNVAGKTEASISSFGEDANGELYATDDSGGRLYRVVAEAPEPVGSAAPETPKDAVKLVVESPDFEGLDVYPKEYTCDGADTSPALSWNTTPPRTRSFVIVIDDPDAGNFSHWVLFNIPPVSTFVTAGIEPGAQLGAGPIQQGRNGKGDLGYSGPCPSDGKEHDYHVTVYALDTTLALVGGATREDVLSAIDGHILGKGELVAKYKR